MNLAANQPTEGELAGAVDFGLIEEACRLQLEVVIMLSRIDGNMTRMTTMSSLSTRWTRTTPKL
jgi:hypothetical protein